MRHCHQSDRELLRATRAGDEEAFACFYRRHYPTVLTYLRRRTRTSEAAADLVGEVFAAALLATHRGDDHDFVLGWLLTVARNKLIDAHRHGKVVDQARRQLGLRPVALVDEDLLRIDELTDEGRITELLDELPSEQREAIRARILDDREYSDIAAELALSDQVVRKRVSRGLHRLRIALEKP